MHTYTDTCMYAHIPQYPDDLSSQIFWMQTWENANQFLIMSIVYVCIHVRMYPDSNIFEAHMRKREAVSHYVHFVCMKACVSVYVCKYFGRIYEKTWSNLSLCALMYEVMCVCIRMQIFSRGTHEKMRNSLSYMCIYIHTHIYIHTYINKYKHTGISRYCWPHKDLFVVFEWWRL